MAEAIRAGITKPKLVVFDLDYTLWPFWVDTHVDPPFTKKGGKVYERHDNEVEYFPEVPAVLERLQSEGYTVAVASRSSTPKEANDLIRLFEWDKYFTYKEIYPGQKTKHFNRFKEQSGIQLEDMLFFDDEYRNIRDLSIFKVTCIHIDESIGVTQEVLNTGLQQFAEKNKHRNS